METPSSTRRSQSKAVHSNIPSRKNEESKQRTRLIDITNGSPVVGLATATLSETPVASITKRTPGSGEALLRGQVNNLLLHQVQQAAEISFDTVSNRHGLKRLPANTPQLFNFNSALDSLESVLESPVEHLLTVSKVVEGWESEKAMTISRSLFMDFSDKSESSSVMTFLGSGGERISQMKSVLKGDDDTWSIQVNASIQDEDEEETKSQGINNIGIGIGMNDDESLLRGKLIRFVYDSDDELIHEDEISRDCQLPKGSIFAFKMMNLRGREF